MRAAMATWRSHSLIAANLTHREYRAFERARIGYTGATEMYARPKDYHGYGPYIATYLDHLPTIVALFKWKEMELKVVGHQWIVRRALSA